MHTRFAVAAAVFAALTALPGTPYAQGGAPADFGGMADTYYAPSVAWQATLPAGRVSLPADGVLAIQSWVSGCCVGDGPEQGLTYVTLVVTDPDGAEIPGTLSYTLDPTAETFGLLIWLPETSLAPGTVYSVYVLYDNVLWNQQVGGEYYGTNIEGAFELEVLPEPLSASMLTLELELGEVAVGIDECCPGGKFVCVDGWCRSCATVGYEYFPNVTYHVTSSVDLGYVGLEVSMDPALDPSPLRQAVQIPLGTRSTQGAITVRGGRPDEYCVDLTVTSAAGASTFFIQACAPASALVPAERLEAEPLALDQCQDLPLDEPVADDDQTVGQDGCDCRVAASGGTPEPTWHLVLLAASFLFRRRRLRR